MRDQVDRSPAFCFNIAQKDATGTTQGKLRQAPQRILGAVGMNGRKRSAMAGIERVKEDTRFRSTYLPYNNPVRPVPQRGFEQVCESDLTLVRIELGFGGDDMQLANMDLGDIFEDQNALAFRDKAGQHVSERGLP